MKYIKEELEDLIFTQNLSYKEIGRRYGVSDQMIKKVSHKLGIDLPVRANFPEGFIPANKGILKYKRISCLNCGIDTNYYSKKYCSKECSSQHRHELNYQSYLSGIKRVDYNNIRDFKPDFLKEQNNQCAICGMKNEWNNKPLVFVLDHIDGNALNNSRDNIRLVCHNCDSQLDTYKSKNKSSGRKDRYLKNYKN